MKFHSFYAQLIVFLLILLCFIIPPLVIPLFFSTTEVFVNWDFPFNQLLNFFILLALFIFCKHLKTESKLSGKSRFVFEILPCLIFSFCLLFFFEFLFSGISGFMHIEQENTIITRPENAYGWFCCILTFAVGAFNEEFLYRSYFADSLILLLLGKLKEKPVMIVSEILCCLLFAFSHLYLGWFSVFNAACAHIVLRINYKKSHTIWTGVTVHFLYNLISLFLIS